RPPISLLSFPTRRSSDLVDDMTVVGVSPKSVTVKSVDIVPDASGHDNNRIIINTDASNSDYPVQLVLDVKYSGAEKIFYIPAKEDRKSTRLNSSHVSISY